MKKSLDKIGEFMTTVFAICLLVLFSTLCIYGASLVFKSILALKG